MGSSGGHRKLPGGSDHFSLQTHKQTLHHNIYIIMQRSGFFLVNSLQVGINYQPPTVVPGGDLAKVHR